MSIKKEDQDGNLNQLLGTLLVPQTPPNKYKNHLRSKNKVGLTLYINFNEERKVSLKDLYDLITNNSIGNV